MKFPHCRAKVKVRFRTGGENCTVLRWTTATRIVRAGVVLFLHGGKAVRRQLPVFLKKDKMKKTITAICLALLFATTLQVRAQLISSFNDIVTWTGTGSKQAALVVDFHDGQSEQSFVWGYRWDGEATGQMMLTAIDQADVGLSVDSTSYATLISYTEQGFTHSQDAYAYPNSLWGYWIAGGSAKVYPWDSSPPYDVSIDGGGTALPTSWTVSPCGTSSRSLSDGSWDAFSFGTYDVDTWAAQVSPTSTAYAAVPEPTTLPLTLLAFGSLLYARKRFHSC